MAVTAPALVAPATAAPEALYVLEDLSDAASLSVVDSEPEAGSQRGEAGADEIYKVRLQVSEDTDEETNQYVGSYAMLMNFLRECHEKGCEPLSEEQFLELKDALDDLGDGEDQHGVNLKQVGFQGNRRNMLKILGAMGIRVAKDTPRKEGPVGRTETQQGNELAPATRRVRLSSCGTCVPRASFMEDRSTCNATLEEEVLQICYAFQTPNNLVGKYSISMESLAGWVMAISAQYIVVPYHNWAHAVDVFFFVLYALTVGQVSDFLHFQDILALQLAAIAHDVGHLGVNNNFLIATGADLAIRYNDLSPLENMHASVFFETMRKPGLAFLADMRDEDFSALRSKIITAILSTDMAKHFEFVDRMTARLEKKDSKPFEFGAKETKPNLEAVERQKDSTADRRLILQGLLHMADLGSSCKQWHFHAKHVVDLEEEFFLQGDQERELGMPIMPMMDRRKDSLASGQGFFLGKMVRPLLDCTGHFMCAEVRHALLANLSVNIKSWEDRLKLQGKKTAAEFVELEMCGA